jgi:hypothetical protein
MGQGAWSMGHGQGEKQLLHHSINPSVLEHPANFYLIHKFYSLSLSWEKRVP